MDMSDIYQTITDKIIASLETAARWQKPWAVGEGSLSRPVNVASGNPYHGINVLLLWSADLPSNVWGTYKQWQAAGAQVRGGEKSSMGVFWKRYDVPAKGEDAAEGDTDTRLVARTFCLFNAEQVDGDEASQPSKLADFDIAAAEAFAAATGAVIRHGGERAFYSPAGDFVQMPHKSDFAGSQTRTAAEGYYGTLAHELTHWTGHTARCARLFGQRFGDEVYAFEELIAELGAAFLCADLGITSEPRPDHACYVASWLRVLKGDKRAVFTAASAAEKAVAFLAALQPQPVAIAAA